MRASSILNCQSTPRCLVLVLSAQAAISDCSRSEVADAAAGQALAGQATQFAFGDVQPTAVLGRVAEVDPLARTRALARAGTLRRTPLWCAC